MTIRPRPINRLLLRITFVLVALNILSVFAWAEGDQPLSVYEIQYEQRTLSVLVINPQARYVAPAFISNFVSGVLIGATDWYLGLHEKKEAFTNPQEIRKAFLFGSESLLDDRSRFSVIVSGTLRELFDAVVRDGVLKPHYFEAMVRLSVASYQNSLPPLHGRLGVLPKGFPTQSDLSNDWGELKNLARDEKGKTDFLPLALKAFSLSGWARVGGHLLDRSRGDIIPIGHPRTLSQRGFGLNEIGDAYEIYHQRGLGELTFQPDPERFQNSTIGQYFLEVLVPESEAEGLTNRKKAKGLLAFYYFQGFKVLSVLSDPSQPDTRVAILGIDAEGWERIVRKTRRRPGGKLLDLNFIEVDFNDPKNPRPKLNSVQCSRFL